MKQVRTWILIADGARARILHHHGERDAMPDGLVGQCGSVRWQKNFIIHRPYSGFEGREPTAVLASSGDQTLRQISDPGGKIHSSVFRVGGPQEPD